MSTTKPVVPLNQYDLILVAAEFMRKNPQAPETKQLKHCKDQSEVRGIVEKLF